MRRPREIASIFGMDGSIKYKKEEFVYLDVDKLIPHPDHKFCLNGGIRMQKLVESIKCAGVLHPILVSERDGQKYLLAGYNRVYANRLAGNQTIPTIVKRNLTKVQEVQIINFTNFFQRGMDDYSYLVRVRALKAEYDALVEERANSERDYPKQRTREYFADLYEMTDSKMQRFLSLSKLNDELLECIDTKYINQSAALMMTELSEDDQITIYDYIRVTKKRVGIKDAEMLIWQLKNGMYFDLDANHSKKRDTTAKVSFNIDSGLGKTIPKGKKGDELIEKSLTFSQKTFPLWCEEHNITMDQTDIYDYILSLLSKIYNTAPELL